jgi:manganese/zinc/iron transport system permease protein
MAAIWILLTAAGIAMSCAWLGCFLVVRRMALIGDAIAHAVLPGIVLAYLLTHQRDSLTITLGAGIIGIIATLGIETLISKAKLPADSAIGLSFTLLFAIGLILISFFAKQIDLDQDCVLYGELAYVPLRIWEPINGVKLGPSGFWAALLLLILVGTFIQLCYRSLWITGFDISFAQTIGIKPIQWHRALLALTSFVVVVSFEAVGAILVVALLVGPPAIAWLFVRNFQQLLLVASIVSIISVIGGYGLAVITDASIAAAISVVIAALLICARVMISFYVH